MTRWAALPRAINAGKALKMADLRAFLEAEGMREVKTLLASGNAVFACDGDAEGIAAHLYKAAREKLALETDWFVRSHHELIEIAAADPFPDATATRPNHVTVMFHAEPVDLSRLAYTGPERLHAIGRELYIDFPEGIGESKLIPAMKKAKLPPSTGRNWNTLLKLIEATR